MTNARSGMSKNCRIIPVSTASGRFAVKRKSLTDNVVPMPSMMIPNSGSTKGFPGVSSCGHLQAIIDTSTAESGNILTMRFVMVYSKKVTV